MRVLLLTSSTGGGHDLRANAFKQWSEKLDDLDIEVKIYRPLEASGWHYQIGVDFYRVVQTYWPGFHHIYWNFLEYTALFKNSTFLMGVQHYVDLLKDWKPDVVVSVHPQLNHGFFDLTRKALGDQVKLVTYCGELSDGYGFSRHWVNKDCDLFIGANEGCCDAAHRLGVPEANVMSGGFMLRPETYAEPMTPDEIAAYLKSAYDLRNDKFTLLLATGALGANNHLSVLNQLDQAELDCQVIALCGKNPEVLETVKAWKSKSGKVVHRAISYTSDMFRLMNSVSAIFTRGGTGTTSEAILTGCAPLTNTLGGTMPQECITIKFLEKVELLKHIPNSAAIVPAVKEWTENPESLASHKQRVRDAKPAGSPRQILERLKAL